MARKASGPSYKPKSFPKGSRSTNRQARNPVQSPKNTGRRGLQRKREQEDG